MVGESKKTLLGSVLSLTFSLVSFGALKLVEAYKSNMEASNNSTLDYLSKAIVLLFPLTVFFVCLVEADKRNLSMFHLVSLCVYSGAESIKEYIVAYSEKHAQIKFLSEISKSIQNLHIIVFTFAVSFAIIYFYNAVIGYYMILLYCIFVFTMYGAAFTNPGSIMKDVPEGVASTLTDSRYPIIIMIIQFVVFYFLHGFIMNLAYAALGSLLLLVFSDLTFHTPSGFYKYFCELCQKHTIEWGSHFAQWIALFSVLMGIKMLKNRIVQKNK